jgi:3-keto-disaccharide hydrolase
MKKLILLSSILSILFLTDNILKADQKLEPGFVSIFNGKDTTGWKIADNGPWEVKNGELVASGARSHLYTKKEYKNFIFKAEVKTTPGSNSGIYFHTKYIPTGWPTHGHETQVNVTQGDPVKTGSIYNVVRLYKTPAKDNEWWTQTIIVKGQRVKVLINDKLVLDYQEPLGVEGTRKISKGSFALQAHDPKSVTYYRNIRVKELP